MAEQEVPQIYLISPPELDLETFPDLLARVLDSRAIACFRLALSSRDEDHVARAADAARAVCHERDVAIVVAEHLRMVERLGLDGVHLNGARGIRDARCDLGEDAIVGAFCGASRHSGMNAGEAGADYVAFGPVGETALGDGTRAEPDLFAWWSEVIEVPVVAEGALTPALVESLAPMTDFFGIGAEIWTGDDPARALSDLLARL
ncbi:thiamine phosphate synthase [Tropicimonas sp. IMCC6043]|uniref:thiamine phosphate synthase n=1 Tax=Tropicimonas sp. IMCC6043 TaxID=2510645 RepID=UPI00101D3F6C|nr:thiamine phosphate synthase [Tropicimonas sp. IMCC6043]RYH12039.1 thiamine phosphate synthase [Tropicimonas sp. IMCC6043]